MTYSEAKKRFLGMTMVKMTDEMWPRCNYEPGEDCHGCCSECGLCTKCSLELKVDVVKTTRRAFLLKSKGLCMYLVIPKKQANSFNLQSSQISTELETQVQNLGLELDEEKFLFCRTWRGKRKDDWVESTYVYPCAREEANTLIIATRFDGCGHMVIENYEEDMIGGRGDRVLSYSKEEEESGCDSIDLWRFRYDPVKDKLILRKESSNRTYSLPPAE